MQQRSIATNHQSIRYAKTVIILFLLCTTLIALIFMSLRVVNTHELIQKKPLSSSLVDPQTHLATDQALPLTETVSIAGLLATPTQDDFLMFLVQFVLAFSGVFLTLVTLLLALAGIIVFSEYRGTRNLRKQLEEQVNNLLQQVAKLEKRVDETNQQAQEVEKHAKEMKKHAEEQLGTIVKRFESDSQKLMDITYTFTEANIAYNLGNNKRAIDYFLRVLEMQPDNLRVMERLGRAYSNLNMMKEAIYYLNKALEKEPNNVPALRSLGLCYRYDVPEKAIETLQQALTLDPKDFESWDFLGLIHRDLNQYDKALDAHHHALELKHRPETQFYLCILYYLINDKNQGRLMALQAAINLKLPEHQERIRPVWKNLISAAVPIIDGKEREAFQMIETLKPYITSKRIYAGLVAHLENLLTATDHKDWISKFTNILEVKE